MWQPKLTRNLRACATLSTHTLLHRSNDRPLVSHQIGVVLQQNRYRCHELTGRKRLGHLKEVGAHREAFFYLRVTALGRQNKDLSPGCSKSVEKNLLKVVGLKTKNPAEAGFFLRLAGAPVHRGAKQPDLHIHVAHTFFNGGTRYMQRVFDTGFLFLHFDFGGSTNLDQCNTAGEFRHTLL